jgi:hypothetical protein
VGTRVCTGSSAGVFVGGNQTVVEVGVIVAGIGVSVGEGVGVGVIPAQAERKRKKCRIIIQDAPLCRAEPALRFVSKLREKIMIFIR